MNRWDRIGTQTALALVAATGILYAWMKYFMETTDPLALVNHPYQPLMLHLHVLAAPLMVFFVGLLARSHVLDQLAQGSGRPRRRSGWVLVAAALPMIFSGYAIQVSTAPLTRTISIWVHLITSGLYLVFFLVHRYRRWLRRTENAPATSAHAAAAEYPLRAQSGRAPRPGAVPAGQLTRQG